MGKQFIDGCGCRSRGLTDSERRGAARELLGVELGYKEFEYLLEFVGTRVGKDEFLKAPDDAFPITDFDLMPLGHNQHSTSPRLSVKSIVMEV